MMKKEKKIKKLLYICMMSLAVIPTYCSGAAVADAGRDRLVKSGDNVVLDGSNSKSDANRKLIYRWTQVKGIKVQLGGEDTMKASFVAPAVQTYKALLFKLTVAEEDSNASDTDFVTIKVQPLAHVDENKTDNCVVVTKPDKYTDRVRTKIGPPASSTHYYANTYTNIKKTNTYHEYIFDLNLITVGKNGIISDTANLKKERIKEYYTTSKDGLYIDRTKKTKEGLRVINGYDRETGQWQFEGKHLPSDIVISRTSSSIHVNKFENMSENTYLPFERTFANKYCKGQSFTTEFTAHTKAGGMGIVKKHKITYMVESINEKKTVAAGTFITIRVKKVDNGRPSTSWIDTKTGLVIYLEGINTTVELLSGKAGEE